MAGDLPPVRTYYRDNISPELVEAQARVFEHLGIELIQCLEPDLSHSQWLDKTFTADRDMNIVCDIDAFPLSRRAFVEFVDRIKTGSVIGLEQVANHIGEGKAYAGPMFLGCTRQTYLAAGSPSLASNPTMDVGQPLTYAAEESGIPVEMIPPQFAMQPRWPLGDRGIFGVGTFYGQLDFFHLFESRVASSIELFSAVADGVQKGRHDFGKYLAIFIPPPPPAKKKGKKRFGLF